MGRRILVTGGAGFIGSNFIHYWLSRYPDDWLVNLDKLTYAGNLANLKAVALEAHYHFVKGDICDKGIVGKVMSAGVDWIVNFAAESHVDRSITAPDEFVRTNVLGTQNLLEYAKAYGVKKFLQISTDEVYGSLGPEGYFTEDTPPAPRSPYSASKTAADMLVLAYYHTYGLPVVITRCSNNYGPYQFTEKLIPLMITKALTDQQLPVYGDGLNIRDWIHVHDHCRAIDLVLQQGRTGEVYNVGGHNERTNLAIVQTILKQLNKPASLITMVEDRPGHDRRYAVATRKIEQELGWQPVIPFETGIADTIQWYQTNQEWWNHPGGAWKQI